MKNWNWFNYMLLIIWIIILVFIFSPSVRRWWCNLANTQFKKQGAKCKNCLTMVPGIIVDGDCIPEAQVIYDDCVKTNASLKDGDNCSGCGSSPAGSSKNDLSGDGVIIDGKCVALPDAFAGKICVPSNAAVNPSALSYKRILVSGSDYKYYKNDGNTVSQGGASAIDTEVMKSDYIAAFVQTMKPCPTGQVKV